MINMIKIFIYQDNINNYYHHNNNMQKNKKNKKKIMKQKMIINKFILINIQINKKYKDKFKLFHIFKINYKIIL